MLLVSFITISLTLGYHFVCLAAPEWFQPTLSLLLSGAICVSFVARGGIREDLLSPPRLLAALYLVFFPLFGLLYLQVPDVQKWYGRYYGFEDFDVNMAWTVFYVVITLPLFAIGFSIGRRWFFPPMSIVGFKPAPFNPVRLYVVIALVTLVAIIGMLLYARSLGGIRYLMESMGNSAERKSWRGQGHVGYYPGLFLITAPAVALLASVVDRVRWKALTFSMLLVGVSLLVLIVTQAAREKALLSILLITLSLYFFRKRQGSLSTKRWVYVVAAVLVAGSLLAYYKHTKIRFQSDRPEYTRLLSDFNRIDVSVVMYHDFLSGGRDHLWGKPLLSYFVQPFARWFGADPIPNTSALLGQSIFYDDMQGDPGAPLAGDLYVNFGFAGYIAFFLAGILFGNFWSILQRGMFEFWTTLLYSLWLYLFCFRFCIQNGFSESALLACVVTVQVYILRWLTVGFRSTGQPRARGAEGRA